ncbi:hypothetical protein [Fibrobacter sp.]
MQYTEYCPTSTNLTVKAGWTHNTALLWIRNLIRILTAIPTTRKSKRAVP